MPNHKDVWVCWLQGIDNAPLIVKKCIESVEFWLKDMSIHIIDEKNLFQYIDLPKYIVDKWKSGVISNTLFSDFIRLSILKNYGGLWLDATVFLTGKLPEYIENSEIFMYRAPFDDEAKLGESWLIKAPKNSPLIVLTLDILCAYWKYENKIRDYFIMFICMKIASEKVGSIWLDTLEVPNRLPLMLERYLNERYEQNKWREILEISSIHKLNYKNCNEDREDTFYCKIVETYRI